MNIKNDFNNPECINTVLTFGSQDLNIHFFEVGTEITAAFIFIEVNDVCKMENAVSLARKVCRVSPETVILHDNNYVYIL